MMLPFFISVIIIITIIITIYGQYFYMVALHPHLPY